MQGGEQGTNRCPHSRAVLLLHRSGYLPRSFSSFNDFLSCVLIFFLFLVVKIVDRSLALSFMVYEDVQYRNVLAQTVSIGTCIFFGYHMCFSNPDFLQAFNSAVAAEKAPAKRKSCAKSQNAKQRMLRSATISLFSK